MNNGKWMMEDGEYKIFKKNHEENDNELWKMKNLKR